MTLKTETTHQMLSCDIGLNDPKENEVNSNPPKMIEVPIEHKICEELIGVENTYPVHHMIYVFLKRQIWYITAIVILQYKNAVSLIL